VASQKTNRLLTQHHQSTANTQKQTIKPETRNRKTKTRTKHAEHTQFQTSQNPTVIDIDNEIISSLQLKRPERYRDIPYILSEAKIIPKTFAETIASMIGFRNLLVHNYASINLNLVYEFLQKKLPDFESFMKHIAKRLEKSTQLLLTQQ
jgi:uncharacterized protein YutE (UPF0331/DUF86 family)